MASTTNWSIDEQFADLKARLLERKDKISETLRLMTRALDILSKSVHVKQQSPFAPLSVKPFQSQLCPALV
jgi:hypothetical protein